MGGSGGSFGSGYNPRDIAKEVRDIEQRLQSDAFKTKLGDMLADLLRDYNNRDTTLVRQRLDGILNELRSGSTISDGAMSGISA